TNNDGIPDGGVIASQSTDANGYYRFDNLTAGDYIVEIAASNFTGVAPLAGYASSAVDEAEPDLDGDRNDNGLGVIPDAVNGIRSGTVTLGPGLSEPLNETDLSASGQGAVDGRANMTVDFGFVPGYSLGNRVWFDTNNNGVIDFGTEVGISGVRVELYQDNGDGVFGVGDTFVTFDTTDANGYYRFDNLPAGDYVVVLADDNFRDVGVGDTVPGNPLEGYWSSGTTINASGVPSDSTANDADTTPTDSDENGITTLAGNAINYVAAAAVTLGPGLSEPLNETDLEASGQGAVDGRANMTVDFGFYQVAVGDLVFVDVNSDGDYDVGTDTPLANALVQLYSSNGTEIITGADGIPGTADDTYGPDGVPGNGDDGTGGVLTGASGLYLFSGLPQGDYIVGVTPPVGYSSTVDTANPGDTTSPNDNVDDNDNGVGVAAGQALSNPVTLTPGSLGAQNNNTVNNNNGTTSNPTVDFGFVNNNVLSKTIFDTSETFTSGTNVAVGEIVTYEILMNLPIGTALNNVTVTDQMEKGLAFVDCLLVEVAGANQTATVCPPAVSTITDPGDSPANPANPGRQVVFSLGNIPAQAAPATLRIRYRAIVLDVNENQQGVILSNNVALAFTGGTLNTSGPDVEIDEPDLVINKTSNPSTGVPIGTPIQFTLTINHSLLSSTDAFDVVVTDILPPELEYIPCSVVYTGLAPNDPAAPAYCPGATSNLVFRWDVFPLGATSTITFNARLVSSPATNTANVAWTSLPIDPQPNGLPVQLSVHNSRSTERWFDPLSSVDVYGAAAVARINASSSATSDVDDVELPRVLPPTGYPPNVFTSIKKQPVDLAYRATDVWLEIPKLGLKMPIVGVPLVESEWNLTWLGDEAGWLEGTAFPSWSGNSVLTGHVTLPDGGPGPFVSLGELKWDDRIIIHAYGVSFEYKVRQNRTVSPFNTSVLQHEDEPWITLITCKTYNEATGGYSNRIAVRAIFVRILDGDSSPGEKNVR
ncbi:MAG: sortase, partial [Anaerolineales bacterium]|nr:sortase [Anaerolineales bacterium]